MNLNERFDATERARSLSSISMIKISEIVIPEKRKRAPREVDKLASQIKEAGRVLVPVILTDGNVLAAGLRRIRACEQLGWESVPYVFVPEGEVSASCIEIAENLHRDELNALERAEQTEEWKQLYLALHPQAGHGKAPGNKGKGMGKASPIKEPNSGSLIDEMARATGKSKSTAKADCQIAENISKENRDAIRELPISEKQGELLKLARLEQPDQDKVVELLADGDAKSVTQAVNKIRGDEMDRKPPALPSGPFDVIVVDPPWSYSNRSADPSHRAANPYPSMTIDEIAAVAVRSIAADNCILWLWTTNAHIFEVPKILSSWGFEHKTMLTWAKNKMGTGDWLRGQTEHCILAARGKPVKTLANETTLLVADMREHSRKPEEFYRLVERLCHGSKCELFSRSAREGWTAHGNETGKFAG